MIRNKIKECAIFASPTRLSHTTGEKKSLRLCETITRSVRKLVLKQPSSRLLYLFSDETFSNNSSIQLNKGEFSHLYDCVWE